MVVSEWAKLAHSSGADQVTASLGQNATLGRFWTRRAADRIREGLPSSSGLLLEPVVVDRRTGEYVG
jgi:hypothetical protein